jgi:hypothetical protein
LDAPRRDAGLSRGSPWKLIGSPVKRVHGMSPSSGSASRGVKRSRNGSPIGLNRPASLRNAVRPQEAHVSVPHNIHYR